MPLYPDHASFRKINSLSNSDQKLNFDLSRLNLEAFIQLLLISVSPFISYFVSASSSHSIISKSWIEAINLILFSLRRMQATLRIYLLLREWEVSYGYISFLQESFTVIRHLKQILIFFKIHTLVYSPSAHAQYFL